MSQIDDMIDEYEVAASVSQTDFSHLGVDDFASVEFDSDGAPHGMVMGVPVAINQPAPAPQIEAPTTPIEAGVPAEAEEAPDQSIFRKIGDVGFALDSTFSGLTSGVVQFVANTASGLGLVDQDKVDQFTKMMGEASDVATEGRPGAKISSGVGSLAGQYVLPAVTGFKALRAVGASPVLASVVADSLTGYFGISPNDENIFNMISEDTTSPAAAALRNLLATDPDSADWQNRVKTAVEALAFLGGSEGLIRAVPAAVRKSKELLKTDQGQKIADLVGQITAAGGSAARGVDQALDRGVDMMGGGNTLGMGVGPVPKAAEAATDINEQGFFSAMSRAVDALPMDKGTGDQMRAMIAKGEGVKAEEMAWTGLDDFLAGKQSVTKQEVRDFVDANQVQVEEVVRADEGVTQNISYLRNEYRLMVEGKGLYANLPPSLREERAKQMLADIEAMEADGIVGPTKFGPGFNGMELTTPGGTNYREVVLRLPERPLESARYAIKDENMINIPSDAVSRQDAIAEAGGDASRVVEMPAPGALDPNFKSTHFPEKNILAHVRTMDRMEGNRKVLFIEEIQSDWWSQGQKRGIRSQATEKYHKEFTVYAEELSRKYDLNPRHNLAMYKTIKGMSDAEIKKYEDLQFAAYGSNGPVRIAGMESKPGGVPNAPFIDTKDKFVALAMRRIIRDAVDKGYDEVSWTSGAMQNARYGNAVSIDKASVGPAIDSPDARVVVLQDSNGADVFFGTVDKNGIILTDEKFKGKSLESIVGKPLAEKLMNADLKVDPSMALSGAEEARLDKLANKRIGQSIAGLTDQEFDEYISLVARREDASRPDVPIAINQNIKVGGKFHRDLYDKIIPKQTEKIIQKFDKSAKVKKYKIESPSSDRYSVDNRDGTTFETDAEGADQAVIGANGDSSIVTKINDTEEVWTISITPKMRDSVLKKGVPLFSAAGAAAATGAAMQNEKQPASQRVF